MRLFELDLGLRLLRMHCLLPALALAACAGSPLTAGAGDLTTSSSGDGGTAAVDLAPAPTTDLRVVPTDPSVPCGGTACPTSGGQACCVSPQIEQRCALTCDTKDYRYECDGPEDCRDGLTCCFGLDRSGSSCATTCAMTEYHLCHGNGDCPNGGACDQLEWGPPALSACFNF